VLGALVVGAVVVGTAIALRDPGSSELEGEPPVPLEPPALAPVALGDPAGTVYATPDPDPSELEGRAAELVATGRIDEAIGVYEELLATAPGRREIALAVEVLRQRRAREGSAP
jgi:hypothetical protein